MDTNVRGQTLKDRKARHRSLSFFRFEAERDPSTINDSDGKRHPRKRSASVDLLDDARSHLLRGVAVFRGSGTTRRSHDIQRDFASFDAPSIESRDRSNPLTTTARLGTALKSHKRRSLSWFPTTNTSLPRSLPRSIIGPAPTLSHQNISSASMAKSGETDPVLTNTSNVNIADSEGVHRKDGTGLDPGMDEQSPADGTHAVKDDQRHRMDQPKPRFKAGKKALSRVKHAFMGRLHGGGTSRRKLRSGGENPIHDSDASAGEDTEFPAEARFGHRTSTPTKPTSKKKRSSPRRDRLSQSSITRKQLASAQISDGHDTHETEPSFALNIPDVPKQGDLEQSFTTAVNKLEAEEYGSPPLTANDGTRSTVTSGMAAGVHLNHNQSIGSQTLALSNNDVNASNTKPQEPQKRLKPVMYKGHPDPLRSHRNVMEFASPPQQSKTSPDASGTSTTPRTEVNRDDDQMTEIDDVPIYSESMGNLSHYARMPSSGGQPAKAPRHERPMSPGDFQLVSGRGAPAWLPPAVYGNSPAYGNHVASRGPVSGTQQGRAPRPQTSNDDKPLPIHPGSRDHHTTLRDMNGGRSGHIAVKTKKNRWRSQAAESDGTIVGTPTYLGGFHPAFRPNEYANLASGHTTPRRRRSGEEMIQSSRSGEVGNNGQIDHQNVYSSVRDAYTRFEDDIKARRTEGESKDV